MHAVVLNLLSTSGQLDSASGCILMHQSYETTGSSTAQYSFWDNTSNTGTRLLTVTLSAGQSTRDYIRKHHLPYRQGLYYHLDSGSVNGSVSLLIDHRCYDCWAYELLGVQGLEGGLAHRVPPADVATAVEETGMTPDGSSIPPGVVTVPVVDQSVQGPAHGIPAYVWPGPGVNYFVPEPPERQ